MSHKNKMLTKPTLDKDLAKLAEVEQAAGAISRRLVAPGIGLVFLALAMIFAGFYVFDRPEAAIIIAAAAIGAYMAMNIGANDVANNVAPAVGSNAMTLRTAIIIAVIFESAGALLAGGDVVNTISRGIIDPAGIVEGRNFVWVMMAALISAALWVNFATWINTPVSTTHAVVGGVMGAGIMAAGMMAVNWPTIGTIAASWVISPLLGGLIAAGFLAFVKTMIIYREDKIAAARRWVPVLIAIMAGVFTAYLALKGMRKIIQIDINTAFLIGLGVFAVSYIIVRPIIAAQSKGMENRNQSLRKLFSMPLIFSAALLSFAHGANDVANAVGPLAAIVHTSALGEVAAKVEIPLWVMVIGAFGISLGLFLFGSKLIRMVGNQITRLNPMRAFCVVLAAAITVIVASGLGLPVSSTHIAVGAVFGVGFFREWYTGNSKRRRKYVAARGNGRPERSETAAAGPPIRAQSVRRKLVRRRHFVNVIAAWVVTVPATAALSAAVYLVLSLVFV